jgi:Zn-finger nucleic acid-binding protein
MQRNCPNCQAEVDVPERARIAQCPACNQQFFTAGELFEEPVEASETPEPGESDHLDAAHIQRVMREHRSLHKMRLWSLGAAIFLTLASAAMLIKAVTLYRAGDGRWTWFPGLSAAAIYLAFRMLQKSKRMGEELKRIKLPEPTTKPTFEGLR